MVSSSPASSALLQNDGWHNRRPIIASDRQRPDLQFRFRQCFWLRGKWRWRWRWWQLRWRQLRWQRVDTGCVIRRKILILWGYISSNVCEGNHRPFLRVRRAQYRRRSVGQSARQGFIVVSKGHQEWPREAPVALRRGFWCIACGPAPLNRRPCARILVAESVRNGTPGASATTTGKRSLNCFEADQLLSFSQ